MAMAITMRRVARILFFATEVTQGPLPSTHYTHIKRPPNSRCVFPSVLEDTTKMTAHSRATGLPDLAGDHMLIRISHPKWVNLKCVWMFTNELNTHWQLAAASGA
jgi:hypothetical protein